MRGAEARIRRVACSTQHRITQIAAHTPVKAHTSVKAFLALEGMNTTQEGASNAMQQSWCWREPVMESKMALLSSRSTPLAWLPSYVWSWVGASEAGEG